MDGYFQHKLIALNEKEYGESYCTLRWVSEDQVREAAAERADILHALSKNTRLGFRGTKLDCEGLSPGCRSCGDGTWSCLFINQICNGQCFYCPTGQTHRAEPSTNGILMQNPKEYVRYLKAFNFKGASISGGEPFLTFERTLAYLRAVREAFGDGIYLWLYTNGIAVTGEKLKLLKEARLDEIRFDISANRYDLAKAAQAVAEIGTVTVEIPAIPEDYDMMRRLIPELKAIGVKHLNLHQLRCTPYNRENLVKRGYTFLHGPKVTVLDSELTALRLLRYTKEQGVGLPINYCSYVFKNRFQTAGQRWRLASYVCKPYEDTTDAGAIRRLCIRCDPEELARLAERFARLGPEGVAWTMPKSRDCLYFNESLWSEVGPAGHALHLDYFLPVLNSGPSYHFSFKEIPLTRKKAVVVEKIQAVRGKRVEGAALVWFAEHFMGRGRLGERNRGEDGLGSVFSESFETLPEELEEIREFEEIRAGLQDYD
ncbi:MAG: radical SAM protein [Desulfatiglandales bacterium]